MNMKFPVRLLSLICTLWLWLSPITLFAELPKTPLEWPYGGEVVEESIGIKHLRFAPNSKYIFADEEINDGNKWDVTDAKIIEGDSRIDINQITFSLGNLSKISKKKFSPFQYLYSYKPNFENAEFGENAVFLLRDGRIVEHLHLTFKGAKFEKGSAIQFIFTEFSKGSDVGFDDIEFSETTEINFMGSKFDEYSHIHFDHATFNQESWLIFSGTLFDRNSSISLEEATFANKSKANFKDTKFAEGSNADLGKSRFSKSALLLFNRAFVAEGSVFNFNSAKIYGLLDFTDATFNIEPKIENVIIGGIFNISGTDFNKGLDLRRADLKRSKIYFNHHTYFPSGKLLVYWRQLKGHFYLDDSDSQFKYDVDELKNRKRLSTAGRDSLAILQKKFDNERYDITEIFYHRLRDNYLTQNDRQSADGVMFELAEKRAEYLKEPLWILYGRTMGWGYKPARFLATVFCVVVLPFAWFWYRRYYHLVLLLVDDSADDDMRNRLAEPDRLIENKRLGLIRLRHFDHSSIDNSEISYLARVWHVLFFSTSLLLGLRFKKEWIEKRDHTFLRWVTAEWLLGIGLYVLFAVLVKSYEFSYVKGLLGF